MKKIAKIMLLLISVFLIVLFGTACGNGANILTDVTLEDDFSGTRVMEVTISRSALRDYFSGTEDDLISLIKANCPMHLSYEIRVTDTDIVCVFKLEFDSIDTYKYKVASIIGEDRIIEVWKGNTLLTQGISYEENFTSKELLEWLSKALVDNNYVSYSYKDEIFASDKTTFIFSEKEYTTSEKIFVSDIQYLPLGAIDILSKPYYDNTYDRTVIFHIPQYTMDKKGEEITGYLEEGVPSNANIEWITDTDSDEIKFKVTMLRYTVDELSSAMKSIFHSDEAGVEKMSYTYDLNMLERGQAFKETIDVSNFASGDYAKAQLRYYLSSECYPIIEDENNNVISRGYFSNWYEDYDGYTCLYEQDITKATLGVSTKISYIPGSINVSTIVKGKDKIERTIELFYNKTIEENEAIQLKDNISRAAEGYAETEYTSQDDGYKIYLKQNGTKEEVSQGFQTIFKTSDSYIRYARYCKMSSLSMTSVFEERLRFDDFFGDDAYNIPINYEAKLTAGEKINEASVNSDGNDDSISVTDNIVSMISNNGKIYCSVVASKFNPYFIIYLLLILVFVAAIATILYMSFLILSEVRTEIAVGTENTEISKSIIRALNSVRYIYQKVMEFLTEKTMQILHKKRCMECKGYIDRGVKYCTKCGVKLDN